MFARRHRVRVGYIVRCIWCLGVFLVTDWFLWNKGPAHSPVGLALGIAAVLTGGALILRQYVRER